MTEKSEKWAVQLWDDDTLTWDTAKSYIFQTEKEARKWIKDAYFYCETRIVKITREVVPL